VAYVWNPSTQEVEREFKASLGYIVRLSEGREKGREGGPLQVT
jgi:hypothetical protein